MQNLGRIFQRGLTVGILFVVMFGVLLFNQKITELSSLGAQLEKDELRLAGMKDAEMGLDQALDLAESDYFVEKWAREENKASVEGDFTFVLLSPPDYQPEAEPVEIIIPRELENREVWEFWLFGDTP